MLWGFSYLQSIALIHCLQKFFMKKAAFKGGNVSEGISIFVLSSQNYMKKCCFRKYGQPFVVFCLMIG